MTRLAPSKDAEIKERISASTSSYTTELIEDTFRLGTVFKSFHYQAKTLIFNRAFASWIPDVVVEVVHQRDIQRLKDQIKSLAKQE